MKFYISVLFSIFLSGMVVGEEVIVESSTSLDLQDVRAFLNRVEKLVASGLDAEELYEFTASTPEGAQRDMELRVIYEGFNYRVVYQVYMDGIDTPSIYWFAASPGFISDIDRVMGELFEDLGN